MELKTQNMEPTAQKQKNQFHDRLYQEMDEYVHFVYKLTSKFPKDELYGATSQLRRSTLSIILNYVEGYARKKSKVHQNFLEISYGSLKESRYLIDFALKEGYINQHEFEKADKLADAIGAMLWGVLKKFNE